MNVKQIKSDFETVVGEEIAKDVLRSVTECEELETKHHELTQKLKNAFKKVVVYRRLVQEMMYLKSLGYQGPLTLLTPKQFTQLHGEFAEAQETPPDPNDAGLQDLYGNTKHYEQHEKSAGILLKSSYGQYSPYTQAVKRARMQHFYGSVTDGHPSDGDGLGIPPILWDTQMQGLTERKTGSHLYNFLKSNSRAPRKIYVHCFGGNGRTFMVINLLIQKMTGAPWHHLFGNARKVRKNAVETGSQALMLALQSAELMKQHPLMQRAIPDRFDFIFDDGNHYANGFNDNIQAMHSGHAPILSEYILNPTVDGIRKRGRELTGQAFQTYCDGHGDDYCHVTPAGEAYKSEPNLLICVKEDRHCEPYVPEFVTARDWEDVWSEETFEQALKDIKEAVDSPPQGKLVSQ